MKKIESMVWFVVCMFFVQLAGAADRSSDINKYVKIFNGSSVVSQKQACKTFEWAGLSDTKIFDLVEKRLLENYTNISKERSDYIAWLAKGLAFSGQSKYQATLAKVAKEAGHKGVRRHATKSLLDLEKYQTWNPIISSTKKHNSSVSAELNRFANMLRSGDLGLQTMVTKRINYQKLFNNEFILSVLDAEVKHAYLSDGKSKAYVNAVANMTKMLAASGKSKYRSTVETVAQNAANARLRKYASKYLNQY